MSVHGFNLGAFFHAATLPNARWRFPENMQQVAGRGHGAKNTICRKLAHEANPCAKIVTKLARDFIPMRFLSLQRLNFLEICVQVCI